MSGERIAFHREAIAEAQATYEWYLARDERAAAGSQAEVDHTVDQIAQNPHGWSPYLEGTRRFFLHKFPYAVIYRLKDDTPEVIAVAHARREPGYWKER